MPFDFRALLQFVRAWVTGAPLTPRRAAVLGAFVVGFPVLQAGIWAGLWLDNLFFRGWRREGVSAPVFIVGNFRSGTTFLHRLVARDTGHFTTMRMWETLFAPSVTGRAVFGLAGRIQRWAGGVLGRALARLERRWEMQNPAHKIGFSEAEEDDYLLLHIFSTLTVGLSSGLMALARPYLEFDQALDPADRRRIMGFYRDCLRRHLFARGGGSRRYLAKNPALIPKLDTVAEFFPDAWLVVLLRDPEETLSSTASMMRVTWQAVGAGDLNTERREFLVSMTASWRRRLMALAGRDRVAFLSYRTLVEDPEAAVRELYRQMDLTVTDEYAAILAEESRRARTHQPSRSHSLADAGISAADVQAALAGIPSDGPEAG